MNNGHHETNPPIVLKKDRLLAVPLALWVVVLAAAYFVGQRINSYGETMERHSNAIMVIEAKQERQQDILIRIDENVKELRRQQKPQLP